MLEKGEYELHARIKGIDPKTKKQFDAQSDTLTYVSEGATEELLIEENTDEIVIEELGLEGEEEEHGGDDLLWGLSSLGFCIAWVAGISFFFYRKSSKESSGVSIDVREAYAIPESLASRITVIRERASEEKRPLNPFELELFAAVKEQLAASVPAAVAASEVSDEGGEQGAESADAQNDADEGSEEESEVASIESSSEDEDAEEEAEEESEEDSSDAEEERE
jgi:hypothetical protein